MLGNHIAKNYIAMKKLSLCVLMLFTCIIASAVAFTNETLSYVIQYKWGLVQKNAGTARLTLTNTANDYNVRLTAATLPWADKIFQVRDTLITRISKSSFKPVSYTKITHENGKYRKDMLTYSYVGKHAYGKCVRVKHNPGNQPVKIVKTCSATGSTYDMLSIFYYIRTLDFPALTKGKIVKANIFSGSAPEIITIRNLGKENVRIPSGKTYSCYHLQFTFTTGGTKNSSAPMNAWVTADARRIPVKLVGSLPIGQVRCFLTGISK